MDEAPIRRELPRWLYFGLIALVAGAFVLQSNPVDRDLWHRLAVGKYIVTEHHLPPQDPYSYLSERGPLHDHEWGCGLLFYALHEGVGPWSLVVLKLVLFLVTLYLIDRAARLYDVERTWVALTHAVLVALALTPTYVSTVRCLVFTNLFLALWIYWLERERAGYFIPLWKFALTAALWANLHGGFPAGLGIIALYAAGEMANRRPSSRFLWIGGVSTLATLCNPYGIYLWTSTLKAVSAPRAYIYEWAATPLGDLSYLGFKILAVVTIALAIGLVATRYRPIDWVGILAVSITLFLAIRHLRHLALFSIVAGVFSGRALTTAAAMLRSKCPPLPPFGARFLATSYGTLLFILALFLLREGQRFTLSVTEPDTPIRAVMVLKSAGDQARPGRLLVPFNWGSYSLWKLYPHYLVSLDGRYELVYSQATYRLVTDFFHGGPDWEKTLKKLAPNAILLPRDPALERRLDQLPWDPGFTRVYADETAAIYFRAGLE